MVDVSQTLEEIKETNKRQEELEEAIGELVSKKEQLYKEIAGHVNEKLQKFDAGENNVYAEVNYVPTEVDHDSDIDRVPRFIVEVNAVVPYRRHEVDQSVVEELQKKVEEFLKRELPSSVMDVVIVSGRYRPLTLEEAGENFRNAIKKFGEENYGTSDPEEIKEKIKEEYNKTW